MFSGQLKTHQVDKGTARITRQTEVLAVVVLCAVKDSPGRQGNWLLVEVFSGQLKTHQVGRGTGCYWCSLDN